MMLNKILRCIFYYPIRLTATCEPIPFEPLKHIKLDHKRPIVYVTVSSSLANLLTIERLTNKLGLPSPFSPLEVGGKRLKRTAYLRSPGLFSSRLHKRDIDKIFDTWTQVSIESGQDIQIVPITVLWSRNPSYEGLAIRGIDAPTPSWRKFLTVTFSGRDNCTIISDPL